MTLTLDDQQTAALLDQLGLPADTDTSTPEGVTLVLSVIADLVAQTAEPTDPKPSAVAASAKRLGMELLDADTVAALQRDAAEGRRIKAAAEAQRIAATVDDAIAKGKITVARRQHWVALIGADPAMADVLASTPAETAVPLSEVGHSLDPADGGDQRDGWFY